jgi:carboxylesterase
MIEVIEERFSRENLQMGEGPVGCYLIHGFTGSTYELHGLAECLAEKGYQVHARLLPGHGTSIKECNLVRAEDWLQETEFHFTEFSLHCKTTFVFPVAGVVAISPAFILSSRYVRLRTALFSPFKASAAKEHAIIPADTQSHRFYGYSSYPLKGLRAMFRLNRYIRAELHRVTAPVLIMHSRADLTAPIDNAALVFNALNSEERTLITYDHSGHVMTDDVEKEDVWAAIQDFIARHLPA